jgi:colanic acid biosynthesis glycosyl transferase WcaI
VEEALNQTMRILYITQWFDPEPTVKGLAFVRALQECGHTVEVLTGFPNYPGGKIYPGYRIKFCQIEMVEGIRVIRVPLYPSHDGSAIKRIFNYLSFFATSIMFGLFLPKRPDLIYVYHPPATAGLAGTVLAALRRVPLVVDIQDLWPDTLRATGMLNNIRALKIIGGICRFIYRRAAKIIVISPGFAKQLAARGVPAKKIEIVYNWCDQDSLRNVSESAPPGVMQGRFNIVFAGTMGRAQALDAVLHAAKIVEQHNSRIQFIFVGGGIELDRLKALSESLSAWNVVFLPRMPMNEIGTLLRAADVLLVHLRDDPLFEITVPSKIQAYFAVGKPILNGVRGDAADLIERAGAGRSVQPQDIKDIAKVALEMACMSEEVLAEMGRSGKEFYERELALKVGVGKTDAILRTAVSPQRR